jgi:hypothetical protein
MEAMTAEQILETPDLIAAGVAGDDARRAKHGVTTTFVRVLEVHVDAVPQAAPPRTDAGEIRVVGKPGSLAALSLAVRAACALAGPVPVTFFSVSDLLDLPESIGAVAEALRQAGAAAIVHLPIDRIENPEGVVRDVRASGLELLTIGIDQLDDSRRLDLCRAASDLQHAVGSFHAFAPLPRTMSIAKPTTGYDDVKMVAAARTIAGNIRSIQVDWQLYGPKMAQVALTVGADDVDNVSAVDPGILGTRRSPLEEIRTNVKAAALEAVERDGLFRVRSVGAA